MKVKSLFYYGFFILFFNSINAQVGIKTPTPKSTLDVAGSLSTPIRVVSASTIITEEDYTVIYSGGTTTPTFTLPDPSTCKGRIYRLVNASESSNYHDISLNHPVKIVNNMNSSLLTINTYSNGSVSNPKLENMVLIQSDGINWWRIGL